MADAAAPRLEKKKWIVENIEDNNEIKVTLDNAKQSVYIYNVKKSVVMIEGKASNITIDGCEELGVVFSDSVSGVESVNSKKLQIQCNGHTPHVQFDKVDKATLYVTEAGRVDMNVVTSIPSATICRPLAG
eukprot:TRINITY_DN26764_c0_g2_i1.p3 TRINITY_DN26764_c0_g2~~TRINITY_DN26764_c0_g2_i1.p3  ORF type:complete len:131 (-),score=27.46 TRINITY_DN26764_c0_g2_i1:51-443(-)